VSLVRSQASPVNQDSVSCKDSRLQKLDRQRQASSTRSCGNEQRHRSFVERLQNSQLVRHPLDSLAEDIAIHFLSHQTLTKDRQGFRMRSRMTNGAGVVRASNASSSAVASDLESRAGSWDSRPRSMSTGPPERCARVMGTGIRSFGPSRSI
jgi:hypothetical protein